MREPLFCPEKAVPAPSAKNSYTADFRTCTGPHMLPDSFSRRDHLSFPERGLAGGKALLIEGSPADAVLSSESHPLLQDFAIFPSFSALSAGQSFLFIFGVEGHHHLAHNAVHRPLFRG